MATKRYILFCDIEKCMACHSCEVACSVEHSRTRELETAIREENPAASRVRVGAVGDGAIPLQCRQCEDAPCVAVCPTKALSRVNQESPVTVDQDLCIGCKWCILACPFGVIRMDSSGRTILKCDQCFERVERGELPACVAACPTKSLQFKSLDEIIDDKRAAYLVKIVGTLGGEEG